MYSIRLLQYNLKLIVNFNCFSKRNYKTKRMPLLPVSRSCNKRKGFIYHVSDCFSPRKARVSANSVTLIAVAAAELLTETK